MTPTYRSGSCLVLLQVGLNPHLKPQSSALAERVHRKEFDQIDNQGSRYERTGLTENHSALSLE